MKQGFVVEKMTNTILLNDITKENFASYIK